MSRSINPLREWLNAKEDEHLEFKEAKNNFHFEKLVKYCAALANEGGGSIVLGVTDKPPRKIVGSQAFTDLERAKAGLIQRLRLRIEAEEIIDSHGRVVVFTAPARPVGVPIAVDGAYWMRAGEDVAPMTPDLLRRIFEESAPDFSSEICPGATPTDLDPVAAAEFRTRWHRRSRNDALLQTSVDQILRDAELASSLVRAMALRAELDARAEQEAIGERTGQELLLRLRERQLRRDLQNADLVRTTELQAHLTKVRQALAELA